MKDLFKNSRFKIVISITVLLLVGMFLASITGHSETAQSSVVGTVFAPAHWVAGKISEGIRTVTRSAGGNAEYDARINELELQVGELENQLADYENLKAQNELYRDALEIKEQNPDLNFTDALVIGRDSANPYSSFSISKGTVNGVHDGDAILYGKYLIGIISKAYPTYSVVCTIINPDFSVSAYDISTNELSYVTGDAELAKEGLCKFENLDASTKISYGSIIATAGISQTMPRGIIIGTVKDINSEVTDISTYAAIKPGVEIDRINECLILTGYNTTEGEVQ